MTATTSKLGADMTDEQREAIESGIAAMEKCGWTHRVPVLRALLARQPAAIDKEPVAEVVMEPFDTWPRLKFVSVESMRNVEAGDMLYAAPPAQTAIADDARDAARYRWLRKEHFPTAENPPLAQVVWKAFDNRHSSDWANMIDGNDLDRAIDAALTAAQSASGDDHAN